MMQMKKFTYKKLEDLQAALLERNINIPLSENTEILQNELFAGKLHLNNRLAIQPMEGADAEPDGSPGENTVQRYEAFANSGAALAWMEAVAFEEKSKANPRQLLISENNIDSFKRLIERAKEISLKKYGFEQKIVMQLTHSGRYSKPYGVPRPIIAYNNPCFEGSSPLPAECIISDDELMRLEAEAGRVTSLAESAGFDAIDIKACHRYLTSELLSAFNRKGSYGGSFENRTRFYLNSVKSAKAAAKNIVITSRLNIYDGFEYPNGFGVGESGTEPNYTEPLKLINILHNQLGLDLINITIGNPYVNPHVNRPADVLPYEFTESPLEGVERIVNSAAVIQKAFPKLAVIGSGLSYFRHLSGNLAAGGVEQGCFKMAGFGRLSFAYPEFANDILKNGTLDEKQVCVTCGRCSLMMRNKVIAGCAIRNPFYKNLFQTSINL